MDTLIKGKPTCAFCNGTGYIKGTWGNDVLCSCVIEMQNEATQPEYTTVDEKNGVEPEPSTATLPVGLQKVVAAGILTKEDIELEYSRAYARTSLTERCEALHLSAPKKRVIDCLDTLDAIIADLRVNKKLPTRSYAIGSETGIGKTTFAVTALKYAALAGYTIMPFIDMSSLAEKYVDYAKEMRSQYYSITDGKEFLTHSRTDDFTWSDYARADLVAVSLTGGNENIAYVELYTLLQLLLRRGAMNKPTIVLMRTTVDYYVQYESVRKNLLKELFALKNKPGTYQLLELHTMFTRERTIKVDDDSEDDDGNNS